MLKLLFPSHYSRYMQSPAASWLQDFAEWLLAEGYSHKSACGHVRRLRHGLERVGRPISRNSSFTSDELITLFAFSSQPILYRKRSNPAVIPAQALIT